MCFTFGPTNFGFVNLNKYAVRSAVRACVRLFVLVNKPPINFYYQSLELITHESGCFPFFWWPCASVVSASRSLYLLRHRLSHDRVPPFCLVFFSKSSPICLRPTLSLLDAFSPFNFPSINRSRRQGFARFCVKIICYDDLWQTNTCFTHVRYLCLSRIHRLILVKFGHFEANRIQSLQSQSLWPSHAARLASIQEEERNYSLRTLGN